MRFKADVLVSDRGLCSHNLKKPTRPVTTSLVLGKDKPNQIILALYTAQNRNGIKYRLGRENMQKVFTKFVEEGKTTLRFLEPAHDVCITKCDKIVLKSFLNVLKKVLTSDDLKGITFSDLSSPASLKQVSKSKTRLVVTNKKDYPITTNFPHTLEFLEVMDVNLRRFDSRMLKLSNLTTLNLADNAIASLPDDISHSLKKLRELKMHGNRIEDLPRTFFQGPMCQTLCLLDLSKNKLKCLSNQISNFSSLSCLNLDSNELTRLPFTLGQIKTLKFLSAAHNQVETLPGSLTKLSLETLDLSANQLKGSEDIGTTNRVVLDKLGFPSLLDISIIYCLKSGVQIPEGSVPRTVKVYIDSHHVCPCGKICLNSKAVLLAPMEFSRISRSYSSDGKQFGIFETIVCSRNCLEKFQSNPFAI